MKKTFKVKNILNNKKKYNFKTELLALAALVLLTPSLSTSCKKDNVNPVNKEEPAKKSQEDILADSIRYWIKRLDKLPVYKLPSGEAYGPKSNFFGGVFGNCNMNNIKNIQDSLSGGTSIYEAEHRGYIPAANFFISNRNNKTDSIFTGIRDRTRDYVKYMMSQKEK